MVILSRLTKAVKCGLLTNLKIREISTFYPVNAVIKNTDFLPGPYPKTKEERRKAAEKYHMHPDEYEPYEDDGIMPSGDYPKLPYKGVSTRDPHYPYDIPQFKRNFNEPVHLNIQELVEERIDAGEVKPYSQKMILFIFFSVFGGYFTLCYLSHRYLPVFQPVMEKQYPWQGKTHYTFEKAE